MFSDKFCRTVVERGFGSFAPFVPPLWWLTCFPLEKPPEKKEPFVIQQEGKFRNRWDCIIFCVVVFILITVPLRIGFDIRAWKPWLAPDYLVWILGRAHR